MGVPMGDYGLGYIGIDRTVNGPGATRRWLTTTGHDRGHLSLWTECVGCQGPTSGVRTSRIQKGPWNFGFLEN